MPLNELALFIIGQLVTGAAIWGGIRVDLKNMHLRLVEYHDDMVRTQSEHKADIQRAHRRIDDILNGHGHIRESNGA